MKKYNFTDCLCEGLGFSLMSLLSFVRRINHMPPPTSWDCRKYWLRRYKCELLRAGRARFRPYTIAKTTLEQWLCLNCLLTRTDVFLSLKTCYLPHWPIMVYAALHRVPHWPIMVYAALHRVPHWPIMVYAALHRVPHWPLMVYAALHRVCSSSSMSMLQHYMYSTGWQE